MTASRGQEFADASSSSNQRKEEDIAATRDYSKLRRAASSQSLPKLKEAILQGGWTAQDINDNDAYNQSKGQQKQRQHASKSALHMAAWKGCLDNVKYLIEDVGCDINAYSKQEFSYGKTAIFFALTQCRPDVTEYLLQKGAKVTIVNNKGQSVLSLAASHFKDSHSETIIQSIQKLEKEQSDWWNFRASHSDGFEYGDLDPRFFNDRPLKDTDVVTSFAINPTTKKTRKGGFLRRNPDATKWTNTHRGAKSKQPKKRSRKKVPLLVLSTEEQCQLDRAWKALLAHSSQVSSQNFDQGLLLEILRLSDKQRASWIPQATTQLAEGFGTDASIEMIEKAMIHTDSISERQLQLLTKMLSRLKGGGQERDGEQQHQTLQPQTKRSGGHVSFDSLDLWKLARMEVEELRISCLEETNSSNLSLTNSPVFVDTPDAIQFVLERLSNSRLVAIDTEWYTPPRNCNEDSQIQPKAALSTLQVAFWNSNEEQHISSFVIDLLQQDVEFQQLAKILVKNLLDACSAGENQELPVVLGFAISHDLPVLQRYLSESNEELTPLRYSRALDLQSLLAGVVINPKTKQKSGPPGLKACVAKYSTVPLSKNCQCSDWGMRPLSKAQLDYAGLDAAILLVLLAERAREESH